MSLTDEIINKTNKEVNKKIENINIINKLYLDIINNETCKNCEYFTDSTKKILPIITNSDIMIITEKVSKAEIKSNTFLNSNSGNLLLYFLNLITPNNEFYITPVIKCDVAKSKKAFDVSINCSSKYLLREIEIIKPRLIITLGVTPMKVIQALLTDKTNDEIQNLELNNMRKGKHKVEFNDRIINIKHTISPQLLLTNADNDNYNTYKKILWIDLGIITKFKNSVLVNNYTDYIKLKEEKAKQKNKEVS